MNIVTLKEMMSAARISKAENNNVQKLDTTKTDLAALTEIIELYPNDAEYYQTKGIDLNNLKKYQKALMDFDETIDLDQNDSEAYYTLGMVLMLYGDYKRSLRCFDKGLKINPSHPTAHNNKIWLLKKLNRHEEVSNAKNKAHKSIAVNNNVTN